MLKEQGYIEKFSDDMLVKYGLSSNDRNVIKYLADKAISEKLYTDTLDYQHNLKHVERVIAYARMIMNKINSAVNEEILMYAALYHDIGKTLGASNQQHGLVGSEEFKKMMKGKIDDTKIDIISKLIFQHASEDDKIDFSNSNYTIEEQKQIQLMSDILKDADALDRNRLNYPAPIGTCDEQKLRTHEAKEILSLTDSFYQDYCKTIIDVREKESNSMILDNYQLLDSWISEYNNGHENMFHASLDPSIDVLKPAESTQKGAYVYAGINPISCFKMATFRSSSIFPRTKINGMSAIAEIFPGSIEQTLASKYITIYRLPNNKFHEYINPVTAAPTREWVSTEEVVPIEQVSFKALDLLNYFTKNNQLNIEKKHDKETQFMSFIKSFDMYIWGVKSIKDNPKIFDQKWDMMKKIVEYYSSDSKTLETIHTIKLNVDDSIKKYIQDFINKNGREPNYDDENECLLPIIQDFKNKIYLKNETGKISGINYDYIETLQLNQEKRMTKEQLEPVETKSTQEVKKGFDQRSNADLHNAKRKKEKDNPHVEKKEKEHDFQQIKQTIQNHKQIKHQNNKAKTLTKNTSGNQSNKGFTDVFILSLIVSFVAGALFMIVYSIAK